jgi:autotransporter-associated beta strand protein
LNCRGITKINAGTVTLTGANTYTGGTTITGGTLQIGNGSTAGSIVGNVTKNAALVFDRSDSVTFGGVIRRTPYSFKYHFIKQCDPR